jgi:hypothetical protein
LWREIVFDCLEHFYRQRANAEGGGDSLLDAVLSIDDPDTGVGLSNLFND